MDHKFSKDKYQNAIKRDLISSFEATGIVPVNANRVLEKLPREDLEEGQIQNIVVEYLKQQRFSNTPSRRNRKRTKLVVEPGKSVTAQTTESSSSESDIEDPITNDDSDDDIDAENAIMSLQEIEETEYMEVDIDDIKKRTFLLVRVLGGMRKSVTYRYVVIVQNVTNDEEIEVLGMKSLDKTKKTFKVEENDEFSVDFIDVIAILPQPTLDGATEFYIFKKIIDVKEMKTSQTKRVLIEQSLHASTEPVENPVKDQHCELFRWAILITVSSHPLHPEGRNTNVAATPSGKFKDEDISANLAPQSLINWCSRPHSQLRGLFKATASSSSNVGKNAQFAAYVWEVLESLKPRRALRLRRDLAPLLEKAEEEEEKEQETKN
ncbi:unnamed protein product [Brassicogethes aeneus]|uniref:Uncharacterized protein n=1 Tax=Brassicogethes aeneus TaxID=1431903 RepID=A0A9P0BGZ1_BRAAE|nr:unnamed protein product [Brassicogethes aeneus]